MKILGLPVGLNTSHVPYYKPKARFCKADFANLSEEAHKCAIMCDDKRHLSSH